MLVVVYGIEAASRGGVAGEERGPEGAQDDDATTKASGTLFPPFSGAPAGPIGSAGGRRWLVWYQRACVMGRGGWARGRSREGKEPLSTRDQGPCLLPVTGVA